MSRFLRWFAIGALCVTVTAPPIFAADGEAAGGAKVAEGEKKEEKHGAPSGSITKVDAAAKSVTVKLKGEDKVFTVNEATVITVEGVAGTLEGLKEGQRARVTADAAGLASKIEVVPAGERKKKKKTE